MKTITPKEAQEMDGLKGFRYAWLTRSICGRFAKFRIGSRVRVLKQGNWYTIERDKWRGTPVPLTNRLCFVPRRALRFTKP